jgi:hypothetical protein
LAVVLKVVVKVEGVEEMHSGGDAGGSGGGRSVLEL